MKLTLKELQDIETEIVASVSDICRRHQIDYFLHCGSVLGALRHGGPIPWDSDVDITIPYNQFGKFLINARKELPEKFYIDYYDTNKDYPTFFPRIGLKGYKTFILHVDIFKLVGITADKNKQVSYARRAKLYLRIFRIKTNLKAYYGDCVSAKMRWSSFILKPLFSFIPRSFIIKQFERLCNKYPFQDAEFVTNLSGGYGIKNVQRKSIYGKGATLHYSGLNVTVPEHYGDYLEHYYGDYMKLPDINERKVENLYELKEL